MSKNNNKEDNNFEYEIVLNRYKIEKKIGKGSFGTVFSAIDQESKEKLAIKTEVDNPENPLGLLESEYLFTTLASNPSISIKFKPILSDLK